MLNNISSLTKQVPNIPVQQQSLEVSEVNDNYIDSSINEEQQVKSKGVSKEQLQKVINGINDFLKPAYRSLEFKFHEKSNKYYAVLVDDVTKEVIREIPPKKMLDMYAAMNDFIGILFDKKI